MVAKNTAPRPKSYVATMFSAKHLAILQKNITEFIDIMRPSFDSASKAIAGGRFSKAGVLENGAHGEKYQSPDELINWLSGKADKIIDLQGRIEQVRNSTISGEDLNNLREIRAFFIRFKSIANHKHGGSGKFSFNERQLQTLLSNDISVESGNGGVFNILSVILHDEQPESATDLGTLAETVHIPKTIQAILVQREKETQQNAASPTLFQRDLPLTIQQPVVAATTNTAREQGLLF